MAQAAMIIHTRTRFCDFPSTFTVCPSQIGSSDADKIRRQVLAATRSIDSLQQNEVRQMVFTCGGYVVAGMVSFLKNLAKNSVDDEKFYLDEKGRGIYAFVGFVFQAKKQSTPLISKEILWEHFKSYMEPLWERTVLEIQSSDFDNIDFQETSASVPFGAETVSGITLYATGADSTHIFTYWLGQALKGNTVSFCSNITDFRVVRDSPFDIITTTANIIKRAKQENLDTSSSNASSSLSISIENKSNTTDISSQKKTPQQEEFSVGKSSEPIWLAIMGVLFVVIILAILISR